MREAKREKMSEENSETQQEMNTTMLEAASSDDALNKSTTVVGIEIQSALEANESESSEVPVSPSDEDFGSIQNLVPSTSGDFDSVEVSIDSLDNSGDEGIGDIMDEMESSTTPPGTSSAPIPPPRPSVTQSLERFQSINLQPKIKVAVVDEFPMPEDAKDELEEEGSSDTLSPLVMDNHIYIEHCEMLKRALGDNESFDDEIEDNLASGNQTSSATVIPKALNSSSSTESEISSSYDSKKSGEGASPDQTARQIDQYDYRNMSEDNNKDSGCEAINKSCDDDDQPIEIPDDDFCEQIVEQVEFYFSDDSLLKDAFLLKHVRRNKEGFVSLKLVSSFKRVRALVKDWRVVGIAIKRKSKKIELNDVETKIRRIEPLPLYDETTPSRTVVATNLPFDKLTIEKVSDIFSKCGEIALVRILRPNCPIPADVRQFVNKHPELQQNECALVEFTESSSARRAQNMDELVVFELVLPKKKTGKKATNMTKMIENFKYSSESENERSRGGEDINSANGRFQLKRNNSGQHFAPRMEHHGSYQYSPSPRKLSLGNENANVYTPPFSSFHQQPPQQYYEIPPRRMSNVCSQIQLLPADRKYSNCSDGCSTFSETLSRRPSVPSDIQRRLSNCSDLQVAPDSPQSRRSSMTCSDHCSCGSRRISQYSNDSYRRMSNSSFSDFPRKFSGGSAGFGDRKYSNASTQPDSRRVSYDTGFERKISSGSMNYERKYSNNGFDPLRKLSQSNEYYINGRKFSTDSGYDRRMSINSITYDNENPIMRSRTSSFGPCANHQSNEPVVRKPIGPDPEGGKGFGSRTRKLGLAATPNVVSS